MIDCILGDSTNRLLNGISHSAGGTSGVAMYNCLVEECTGDGIRMFSGGNITLKNCVVRNNGDNGLSINSGTSGPNSLDVQGCIIHGNTDAGIELRGISSNRGRSIKNNIFYGNGGSGIHGTADVTGEMFSGNVFAGNGGHGINLVVASDSIYSDYNAFHGNTSGEVSGVSNGPNDITLTADPFVDAASGDFNIDVDSLGGQELRDALVAMPGLAITNIGPFRQWLDPLPSGGGGSSVPLIGPGGLVF
jgi:parallel beta-helix repeat protein